MGGAVRSLCPNAYIGALLFCVGLLIVCHYQLPLYTGAVGFLPDEPRGFRARVAANLLLFLFGNTIGAACVGLAFFACYPEAVMFVGMYENLWLTALLAIGCGAMMYVAVCWYQDSLDNFTDSRNNSQYLGVLFCVPVFILCGYRHCIADVFYLFASGAFMEDALRECLYILWVAFFNGVGAIVMNFLTHREE